MDQTQLSSKEKIRNEQIEHGNAAVRKFIVDHESEAQGLVMTVPVQGQVVMLCWSCGANKTIDAIEAVAWATVNGGENPA